MYDVVYRDADATYRCIADIRPCLQCFTLKASISGLQASMSLPLLSYTTSKSPAGIALESDGLPQTILAPCCCRVSYWLYGALLLLLACIEFPACRVWGKPCCHACHVKHSCASILHTSSPSFRMVTEWPLSSSCLARCRPINAWPPPLVFAINTLSARTCAQKDRLLLVRASLGHRATGRPEVKLPDFRLHACSNDPAIGVFPPTHNQRRRRSAR